jgi:hypothetical protein
LTNCGSETFIPGRATISGNLQGPGVYVECYGEHRVTDTAAYLQNHYKFRWIPANQYNASNVLFAVKIKGDGNSDGFFIGRVNLAYANSTEVTTSYTQVGKIHVDNGNSNLWYADANQQGQPAYSNFEVLICAPPVSYYFQTIILLFLM